MAGTLRQSKNPTQAGSNLDDGPWPFFSDDEIEATVSVLKSGKVNYWTGDHGKTFEREFADFCHTRHAVAMANGTLTLELALRALEIGPGDEVVVTPRTFLASATTVLNVGATPVFADIDPITGNLSAESIEQVITPKTKAVIPVHLAGWPCEMAPIMDLAKAKNLMVIEDCAQAHGAKIDGKPIGQFGHINSWSFCQDKIMTTGGEGGMVTLDDEDLWKRIWSLKDHGKGYDTVHNQTHPPGFRWLHESLGTNARMTEMQAAIGRLQLQKLPDWHAKRTRNAQILIDGLSSLDQLKIHQPRVGLEHAYYKFYAHLELNALKTGWTRQRVADEICRAGIQAFSGTCCEVYLEKVFVDLGLQPDRRLPNAQQMGEDSLMLLVHPTLPEMYLQKTVEVIHTVLAESTR